MRHHGKRLNKLMEEAAKAVLRQEAQQKKDQRKQRQRDRRQRYGKSTEGTDPRPDPGQGSPAPSFRSSAKEGEEAGEDRVGRPWDDC